MSLIEILILLIKVFLVLNIFLIGAAYVVLMERKVAAWIQNRVGPNRVGPWGMFQSFADVLKLVLKEDIVPVAANKTFHLLAPVISIGVAISAWMVMPFAAPFHVGDTLVFGAVAPEVSVSLLILLS